MTGSHDDAEDGFAMTDIEERLRGPDGAAERDAVLARLSLLSERVEAALRAGLKPDVYAEAQAVQKALAAARDCMLAVAPRCR